MIGPLKESETLTSNDFELMEKLSMGKYGEKLNQVCSYVMVKSSDQDIIFLGQASIGIKNNLQKKNLIFYVRKEQSKKSNFY